MRMWTEEEFNLYKGSDQFLEVRYYGGEKVSRHKTYADYVETFNDFRLEEEDAVSIPRKLLLYLQERVDPQNEYAVWVKINQLLQQKDIGAEYEEALLNNLDDLYEE